MTVSASLGLRKVPQNLAKLRRTSLTMDQEEKGCSALFRERFQCGLVRDDHVTALNTD